MSSLLSCFHFRVYQFKNIIEISNLNSYVYMEMEESLLHFLLLKVL